MQTMLRVPIAGLILVIATLTPSPSVADSSPVGVPSVAPAAVTEGIRTDVIISVAIDDRRLVPGSVNVERLDRNEEAVGAVAKLHDNGQHGDLIAGDGIFTARLRFLEHKTGTLKLRISAAFRNPREQLTSEVFGLEIVQAGIPNQTEPSDLTRVITDPHTGVDVVCGEIVVRFLATTTFEAIEALVISLGATIVGRLPDLGFWQLRIPCGAGTELFERVINQLMKSGAVESAEPNFIRTTTGDPLFAQQWGLALINISDAWSMTTGRPLGIGIVDSGVDNHHPDLLGQVGAGYHFV